MKISSGFGALALVLAAGAAMAQPTVDGNLAGDEAYYGDLRWSNNVPTGFGDTFTPPPCDPAGPGGDPAAVTTGTEIKIPLASIGNPAGAFRILAAINNGGTSYFSNQFLPPLPGGTGNLGGNNTGGFNGTVSQIDLTLFAGDQFLTVTPAFVTTLPVVDGQRDGVYGAALSTQVVRTGFGNNESELNALYVVRDATHLYIFISGNSASGNKYNIFLDTDSTGTNPASGMSGGLGNFNGMTFDAGFTPDYVIGPNRGGDGNFYVDFGVMGGGNDWVYQGRNPGTPPEIGGLISGGNNTTGIEATIDNSNTAGVDGPCPPSSPISESFNNGNELNGLYARIDEATGRLNLLLTGNLGNDGASPCDRGGNKINLLFDADGIANGQQVLRNDNVDISFNNLNRLAGLQLEADMFADYWASFKVQGSGTNATQNLDVSVLRTNGRLRDGSAVLDYGAYDGAALPGLIRFDGYASSAGGCNGNANDPMLQTGSVTNLYASYGPRKATDDLLAWIPLFLDDPSVPPFAGVPDLINAAMNNSNSAGVTTSSAVGSELVTTGLELSIALSELGWDGTSCIKIAGFIANGDASFVSNQVIGGLPSDFGNLADPATVNFPGYPGTQYIEVCPGDRETGCPCPFDYNNSGTDIPDIDDLIQFFDDFNNGLDLADVNCTGAGSVPDVDDLLFFFDAFNGTGPCAP